MYSCLVAREIYESKKQWINIKSFTFYPLEHWLDSPANGLAILLPPTPL